MTPTAGALKLKAQVVTGNEIAMGPGKADLLEAIEREGSISAAGRSMGMSYRRAWELVDAMNRCWIEPLVEAVPGGGRTRGARLTDAGHQVLQLYRGIERGLLQVADGQKLRQLTAMLREPPLPRSYK